LITSYVPDRASRSCPDSEILGTGSGEVFGGGQAKPDQTPPDAEKDSSRDPAAMEGTQAKDAPYSLET
jgi:hypothetical protein